MTQTLAAALGGQALAILDAGTGGRRWRTVTPVLIAAAGGPIAYLERNAGRRAAALQAHGPRLRLFDDAVDQFWCGETYDLVYVDVPPRQLERFFASVLPALRALLRPRGRLAATLPVGRTGESAALDEAGFAAFARAAGLRHADAGRFAADCLTAMLGAPPARLAAANEPAAGFAFATFLAPFPPDRPLGEPPFAPAERMHFAFDDAVALLEQLQRRVAFCSAGQFLDALAADTHCDAAGRPLHFVKHDIHRDLLAAWRFAEAEARLGIRGAFFVMHPHPLSAHYIDRPETLEVLRAIQSLGHEIGVHVDVAALGPSEDTLTAALIPFLADLRAAGIGITMGNAHGNTALRDEAATGFVASLFEERDAGAGAPSLARLAARLGLVAWFDSWLYREGRRLPAPQLFLGDNYRRLDLYAYDEAAENGFRDLMTGRSFDLAAGLRTAAVEVAAGGSCLHLVHPQYYR